jgi:nifR3 family TIM-barrel protein
MLQLGTVRLKSKLLLSPIAGYCDLAFRLVIRRLGGVGLACTALVNPRGILRQTRKTQELLRTEPADSPLCIQLYGHEPLPMAEAARWCQDQGAAVIDINMGCPADKVTAHHGGASLLRNPLAAVHLAEHVVKAVSTPVTVKMRLGWDSDSIVAPELARRLEEVGIAGLTVHGRTAVQRFSGSVSLEGITGVVAGVRSIPVIGNGDIRSPQDALTMLKTTGCAGVMIGRAALRDPWIFTHTQALLSSGTLPPPPDLDDRVAFMNQHFENLVRLRGECLACLIFRQRASWYAGKFVDCYEFKDGIRRITTASEYWRLVAVLSRRQANQ